MHKSYNFLFRYRTRTLEHTVHVRGARLPYSDQGGGEPVLLLHGALTDHRMWREHAAQLAHDHRVLAYTQRFHWGAVSDEAAFQYGVPTHSADLVAFVDTIAAGPVHLVAWSYSCQVALDAMVRRPDLFASVFAYEPGHPSWLHDEADLAAFGQQAHAAFGPVFEAVAAGDNGAATERLLAASGGRPGYFASQPDHVRQCQLDNAGTLPLLLNQQPAAPLTLQDLDAAGVPLQVLYGARSHAMYRLVGKVFPGSGAVEGQGHMWPQEDPHGFCDTLRTWLSSQAGRLA